MPKVPVLKPREVVALLIEPGFTCVRQRGSHMQFRHPDGRDISPSLLRKVARDFGMAVEEFVAGR